MVETGRTCVTAAYRLQGPRRLGFERGSGEKELARVRIIHGLLPVCILHREPFCLCRGGRGRSGGGWLGRINCVAAWKGYARWEEGQEKIEGEQGEEEEGGGSRWVNMGLLAATVSVSTRN